MMDIPKDWCVLVPHYNGGKPAQGFLRDLLKSVSVEQVLVVDDGSSQNCDYLKTLSCKVLFLTPNQGKAQAIIQGVAYLKHQKSLDPSAKAFTYVLTMDCDGQHAIQDIASFVRRFESLKSSLEGEKTHSLGIMVGKRDFSLKKMPWPRIASNSITTKSLEFLSKCKLYDSQCGFRLYHQDVFELEVLSCGFQWESEILVRGCWAGWRVDHALVQTIYGEESSSIAPWRDTWNFIKLFGVLLKQRPS